MRKSAAVGGAPDQAGMYGRSRRVAALRVVDGRADTASCLGRHPARPRFASGLELGCLSILSGVRVAVASLLGMLALVSAATPAARDSVLRGKTIAIDPGHNGRNWAHSAEINRLVDAGTLHKACDTTGTSTASGYAEPAFTFDVALRLRAILRAAGARVVLTRTSNTGWGPCITERAAIGNRAPADAAISIHADGGPASGRGFHVIYPPSIRGLTDDIARPSKCLALAMRSTYRVGTGMAYATYLGGSGLSVRSDLGGLNLSDVPKVFVETGNMRNGADGRLLESAAYRQRIARALAGGLTRFLSRC